MYPPHEHALYAWLIIIGCVCLAVILGALLWRIRFMHTNRAVIQDRRRGACIKD